jgi:hypothetical protein
MGLPTLPICVRQSYLKRDPTKPIESATYDFASKQPADSAIAFWYEMHFGSLTLDSRNKISDRSGWPLMGS